MCSVFVWGQTATCATYSTNWLVFITEMKSVYSAVRIGSLNKAMQCNIFNLYRTSRTWEKKNQHRTVSINGRVCGRCLRNFWPPWNVPSVHAELHVSGKVVDTFPWTRYGIFFQDASFLDSELCFGLHGLRTWRSLPHWRFVYSKHFRQRFRGKKCGHFTAR
jgi:hypothetical protein